MNTFLLDLTPGLATVARVVADLPAGQDADPSSAAAEEARDDESTGAEADRDCKPG